MPPPTPRQRPSVRALLCACALAPLGLLAPAAPSQAQLSRTSARSGAESSLMRALLRSRELWATIDVCNPADQPGTVGIRGSMPGDKHPHDTMWMSFRLQYLDSLSKQWFDLSSASTKYIAVGHGGSVRQAGRSFKLVPKTGRPSPTLRGVVDYQWRRGSRVMQSGTRSTSAGHTSRAGADPAGFNAATCVLT